MTITTPATDTGFVKLISSLNVSCEKFQILKILEITEAKVLNWVQDHQEVSDMRSEGCW